MLGYDPVSNRIAFIRIKAHPYNITVIQFYAPTSDANDEAISEFYEALQDVVGRVAERDALMMMGNANAKVGCTDEATTVYGRFGNLKQNERGQMLIEFCQANRLAIANTTFKQHPRS